MSFTIYKILCLHATFGSHLPPRKYGVLINLVGVPSNSNKYT